MSMNLMKQAVAQFDIALKVCSLLLHELKCMTVKITEQF